MVVKYNCVVDNGKLSVLRWGATSFEEKTGHTVHYDVGPLPRGTPLKYVTIFEGKCVPMKTSEKLIVDAVDITKATVLSMGALELDRFYKGTENLPVVPAKDGLFVGIILDGTELGLAISHGGKWFGLNVNQLN